MTYGVTALRDIDKWTKDKQQSAVKFLQLAFSSPSIPACGVHVNPVHILRGEY